MKLNDALEAYLIQISINDPKAINTIEAYSRDIKDYLAYLNAKAFLPQSCQR